MKFNTLFIRNFGSIHEVDIPLSDQGLVLITGINKDAPKYESNGSGKSLLLDALTWCLWGETVRGFSTDDIVNKTIGKDCYTKLIFEEGSDKYEVCRYRKHSASRKPNDLELRCNGTDVSGSSITETQNKINDILGLDFVTFCAMMPGAGVNVAELTDTNIKELLEKLLRTELLGKARENAKEKLKSKKLELQKIQTELNQINLYLKEAEARIDQLKEKRDSFEENKEHRIFSIQDNVGKILDELEKYDAQMSNEEKIVDQLNSAKSKKVEAQQSLKQVHTAVDRIRNKCAIERTSLTTKKNKLSAVQQTFIDSKNQIEELEGSCPTCLQEVEEGNKSDIIEDLDKRIDSYQQQINEIVIALETLKSSTQEQLKPLEDLATKFLAAEVLHRKDEEKFETVYRDIETAKILREKAWTSMNQLSEQQEKIQSEENPFLSIVKEEEIRTKDKKKEEKKLNKKLDKLAPEIEILEFWVDGFSQSGLRSYVLKHVTPVLNSFAQKYCQMLTDNEMKVSFHTSEKQKNGKMKEKFNVQVKHVHGGTSYKSSSSGERARANLVAALALGDLAAMRANKKVPFKFLDEPFEHVDGIGTEAIVSLLNSQRGECDTVFVITHEDHFKQLFTKQWTMVKEDGFSSWRK